jgi:uncharacterized protein with von Willebrand factor type A (vWA) domain
VNKLFSKFETFGLIASPEIREKVALAICEWFKKFQGTKPADKSIGFSNSETENFASPIEQILKGSNSMLELCNKDANLAEKITQEILDFTDVTKKIINRTESPFEKENELLSSFKAIEKTTFPDAWKTILPFIQKIYADNELDGKFYEKEFVQSLKIKRKKVKAKASFQSVKEHFTEKWEELLTKKQIAWELEIIERERKKFCEELYRKIEELKKLQKILEPFTSEVGRLWDMSKGDWQKTDFDILKRYAEILQKDKSINDLAEMLGRMRQAEREYEEEVFTNTVIKPEWKVEHSGKSDLVGIHESDDLSSLLPTEAALLADERTELIFYKKFAEKKLQTFDYHAKILSYKEEEFQDKRKREKEDKKGPFIICVDTSGSMQGIPETVAKTLAFAILKIAIRENRKCYLISFSTGINTLELSDMGNSLDKIIDFLSMSFYGGTDASPAMIESLRMLETKDYKKADVIVVSDFVMSSFSPTIQRQIANAKENKTKFHSLVIGDSQNPRVSEEFDNNWFYDSTSSGSTLKLVQNLRKL